MPRKKTTKTQQQVGLMYGFRSGLENTIANQLMDLGINYTYECTKLGFVQPAKKRTYTPDFKLTKKDGQIMFIETKGRFTREDRQKMELLKDQYPDMDIRLLFNNSRNKIYKGAKSTYADWCNKVGFKYADKTIPQEWLDEVL